MTFAIASTAGTGTVSISAGTTAVTGKSTAFAAGDVGKLLIVASQWAFIKTVVSTTSIVLDAAFATTVSNASYALTTTTPTITQSGTDTSFAGLNGLAGMTRLLTGTGYFYYMPAIVLNVTGTLTIANQSIDTILCSRLYISPTGNYTSGTFSSDGITPLYGGRHFVSVGSTRLFPDLTSFDGSLTVDSLGKMTLIGGSYEVRASIVYGTTAVIREYGVTAIATNTYGAESARFRSYATDVIKRNCVHCDLAYDLFRMPTEFSVKALGAAHVAQYIGSSVTGGADAKFTASALSNLSGTYDFDNYAAGWVELFNCAKGANLNVVSQNNAANHFVPLFQDIKFKVTNLSGVAQENVRVHCVDESVSNTPTATYTTRGSLKTWDFRASQTYTSTTNASGIASISPALQIWHGSTNLKNLRFAQSTATINLVGYSVRQQTVSVVLGSDFAIEQPVTLVPAIGLTLTEAQAGALTGITFSAIGATGGEITLTSGLTVGQVWQAWRYWKGLVANISSSDSWELSGTTVNTGSWTLVGAEFLSDGSLIAPQVATGGSLSVNVTGNVTQATPTDLTGATITGNLTYNTNTPIAVTVTNTAISGTVTNSGSGLVTIRLSNSSLGAAGANVTTQIVTALNITGLTAGSQIYISDDAGANVAYVASSSASYTMDTTGRTGTWTWKVARYGFTSQSGTFNPATSGATISVSLIADPFITQGTAATVAAYATLENPDKIYDYAAYFETTNAGIALARIAAKQGTNVSLGAYNATLNAAGTVLAVAGNTITVAVTEYFVGGSTMTGGLTTSGNVTLNAQATIAGTYAPISANNIALASLPNYQSLSAITAITGLPTTGTVSAAGSLGLGTASLIVATGDITFNGTALAGSLAMSKTTETVVTLTDCTGAFTVTKGDAGNVKAIVSGVTQRSVLPAILPTGVSLFALCSVARFGGGAFNLVARHGTTDAYTDLGYHTGQTAKTFTVPFGQPVELAMWSLGYLTFVRTLTTTGGGFAIQADMVTEPDVDTTLDVSAYLDNITVSNSGGVFAVIFGSDMSIPGLEQAKAIVHRLLALESSMRALLPPGSSTIIDIKADEIQINLPGVWLALGTGVNTVEIAGYFNTQPAKAINSAYVLNPRRPADNLRVEIPLVKPAIDAVLLARAVRAELATELAQADKVAKLHGVGAALVVTPTTRVAGSVSQTITTTATTTTVQEV
jgi:hypothetical protein